MTKWVLNWVTVGLLILFSGIALGQDNDMIPGQLIVLLEPDASIKDITQKPIFYNQQRIRLSHNQVLIDQINLHLFTYDTTLISPEVILPNIRKLPKVLLAQFNHKVEWRNTMATFPNDPGFTNQWGLHNTGQFSGIPDADIDAPEAWDIATGGLSVLGDTLVAAVVDDGIALGHSDLPLWKNHDEIPLNGIDDDLNGYIDDYDGWDAFGNDGSVPSNVHGTLVAGIVSAKTDNNNGIAGVSWDTKIMPVAGSSVNEAVVAVAYGYVLKMRTLYNQTNGAEGAFVVVTNSSFGVNQGNPANFPIWCALYDSLGEQGILSVVSTMNIPQDVDIVGDMPSTCASPWVIAVTNTTNIDQKRNDAAFGLTHIDLGAPGTQIYSTITGNNYGYDTGTSFASPFVAGAISVMYSVACPGFMIYYKNNPANGALKIKDYLLQSVDTLTDLQGITATGGRLNLHKSLLTLIDSCSNFSNGCLPPFNLSISSPTDTSIQLNWVVADSLAQQFRVLYKKQIDTVWQHLLVPNDTFFVLNGLEKCTDYEFQVETICDSVFGTSSGFFTTFPFQTEGCCLPPENLEAIAINDSQFTAVWNPVFGVQSYTLSYRLMGMSNWMDTTISDTSFQIHELEPCTDYEFRVKATCNGLDKGYSDTLTVLTFGCGACLDLTYCESMGEDVGFEWIEEISIGPLFNQSGKNGGYGDFTGNSFQIVIDSLYDLTLTPGYSGFAFEEAWRVWVDLNQNGLFDSTELIFGTNVAQSGVVNGQFLIPGGTLPGATRMRISMRFGGFSGNTVPAPCETFMEGEVEDYCIELTSETSEICPAPSNLTRTFTQRNDSVIINWDSVPAINNQYQIRLKKLPNGQVSQFSVSTNSISLSGLLACEEYEVSVRSKCDNFFSSFSPSLVFRTKGCGACLDNEYCQINGLSTVEGWIREVNIGKLSHITGDDNGYEIFENISFNGNRGNTYDFRLTSETNSGQNTFFWAIFMDSDQNGTFESNEMIYNSHALLPDSSDGQLTIPPTANLGKSRIRIVMSKDSIFDACTNPDQGEVQDYCFEVLAGDNNEGLLALPEIKVFPNPARSEIHVESEKLFQGLRIINLQGQEVIKKVYSGKNKTSLQVQEISKGVYILEIQIGQQRIFEKILIE